MNASEKKSVDNTPVEEKKVVKTVTKKNVQDNTAKKNAEVIKMLDKKFELLDEINKRLKKVEERMGI